MCLRACVQLTFEQPRSELRGSLTCGFFFNKYIRKHFGGLQQFEKTHRQTMWLRNTEKTKKKLGMS